MTDFYLRQDLAGGDLAQVRYAEDLLQWAESVCRQAVPADIYRQKEGRTTLRVRLAQGEFFVKFHRGIGWREIGKNLLSAKRPVLGAGDEYRALRRLQGAGIRAPAIAAFAQCGANPARRRSVIVTDALTDSVSLETLCADWLQHPPPPALRRRLICEVALIARKLHDAGINHRDFYLCHFHYVEPRSACYLIDLHRAQIRQAVPVRWRVKDLAGLYFSALDVGLTERDKLRFMRHYTPGGLREALQGQRSLWRRVERAARALYRRERGVEPAQSPGGRGL